MAVIHCLDTEQSYLFYHTVAAAVVVVGTFVLKQLHLKCGQAFSSFCYMFEFFWAGTTHFFRALIPRILQPEFSSGFKERVVWLLK